jgi:hypothetical protein
MAPLVPFIKRIIQLMDEFGIVVGCLVVAFALGYDWKRPVPPDQPRTIATQVDILSVESGSDAFRGADAFLQDSLHALQDLHTDGVVSVVTSSELDHNQHFQWVLSLIVDFQPNFALSQSGAYLRVLDRHPASFTVLDPRGRQGPPYGEITVEVLQPEKGEQIVVVLCIYPTRPGAKFPGNVKRMLERHLE